MGKLAKPEGDVYGQLVCHAIYPVECVARSRDGTFHPANAVDARRLDDQRGVHDLPSNITIGRNSTKTAGFGSSVNSDHGVSPGFTASLIQPQSGGRRCDNCSLAGKAIRIMGGAIY